MEVVQQRQAGTMLVQSTPEARNPMEVIEADISVPDPQAALVQLMQKMSDRFVDLGQQFANCTSFEEVVATWGKSCDFWKELREIGEVRLAGLIDDWLDALRPGWDEKDLEGLL